MSYPPSEPSDDTSFVPGIATPDYQTSIDDTQEIRPVRSRWRIVALIAGGAVGVAMVAAAGWAALTGFRGPQKVTGNPVPSTSLDIGDRGMGARPTPTPSRSLAATPTPSPVTSTRAPAPKPSATRSPQQRRSSAPPVVQEPPARLPALDSQAYYNELSVGPTSVEAHQMVTHVDLSRPRTGWNVVTIGARYSGSGQVARYVQTPGGGTILQHTQGSTTRYGQGDEMRTVRKNFAGDQDYTMRLLIGSDSAYLQGPDGRFVPIAVPGDQIEVLVKRLDESASGAMKYSDPQFGHVAALPEFVLVGQGPVGASLGG